MKRDINLPATSGKAIERACPITKTLGYLSKKWTLIILRELHTKGKKRFGELLLGMGHISPRTLSKRLKELEKVGLISRKKFGEIPPRVEYALTGKGGKLILCFKHIDKWAKEFEAT